MFRSRNGDRSGDVGLLPLHVAILGVTSALVHALFGLLVAAALIDGLGLFLNYRKLPFVCSHVPIENPKLVAPAVVVGYLVFAYGFAAIERFALQTGAAQRSLALPSPSPCSP
jgi:hypothetical protein